MVSKAALEGRGFRPIFLMKPIARHRIARIVEKWLLVEPLLLATWTSHALVSEPRIKTIRVQRGRIEYNPEFIAQLSDRHLEATLRFEALRILLKHPYSRRQAHSATSYAASNLTLQEYLQTELPFPRARDVFGDRSYDKQFFEFYYHKLLDQVLPLLIRGDRQSPSPQGKASVASGAGIGDVETALPSGSSDSSTPDLLEVYTDANLSGVENTDQWDRDELLSDRLDDLVRMAQANDSWGSIGGKLREHILANLHPKLDYRAVLRKFRTSILSQQRRLTRMKPNRRYGFAYMGSRRDFTTRLLFAIDVSGSMGTKELRQGFSVVNRFFNYGVPAIDVIQFDTQITADVMTFRRAKREVQLTGRGGTNFDPVLAYLEEHRDYDGLIIYTDGYAPCPAPPQNRRTRILWLFVSEAHYRSCYPNLEHLGQGAYLKSSAREMRVI
ncbi:VWA-like domain-containing protein [Roseofilum sp. BLCC_M91]|uniref:VWA-like domain-containing protein n=1 Tax=Roseofilum halophilum BLCC-M91 TaxID=3022259 RepID=A0ABT7BLI3_9CYAN|nr:VWA-like domain-containing protein [Roseofilum halophilum]MDJ1179316.1 VWA-like domain-containing protein [Roseofilum halophilum BLCC-M91]